MSTTRDALHVNECCVCAVPPPGNLLTGPAATSPFRSPVLSGCQLPSMPCSSNYRLWIRSALRLAVRVPRLATAQIRRRRQPGLCVATLKSQRRPAWSSPAQQT